MDESSILSIPTISGRKCYGSTAVSKSVGGGSTPSLPASSSSVMASHLLWEQGIAGSSPVSVTNFRGVAERLIAEVCYTSDGKTSVGSNPTSSILGIVTQWSE